MLARLTLFHLAAALVLLNAAILASALLFQYAGGYPPCTLCYWQRYANIAALGLAALALVPLIDRFRVVLLVLAGLVLLGEAGIAAYHTGVEQHWWAGPSSCTGDPPPLDTDLSLAELQAALKATSVVRCDEIPWSLFGISMAGYNIGLSLGLGLATFWGLRRLGSRQARH